MAGCPKPTNRSRIGTKRDSILPTLRRNYVYNTTIHIVVLVLLVLYAYSLLVDYLRLAADRRLNPNCLAVFFRIVICRESCVWSIFTNSVFTETRELELSRVGLVSWRTVSRLSRSPGCCESVRPDSVHFSFCFFERTRPAACMRPPCLIFFPNSIGCVQAPIFLFVCCVLSVCNSLVFLRKWWQELDVNDFHKPGVYRSQRIGANV